MVKDYRIEKRDGAMIWKVELKKLEKDLRIHVPDDCVALFFAGGECIDEFRPSENKMLNEGGRVQKAYKKADYAFYVFNRVKPVEVKWGVGRTPITYEDRKLGGITLSLSAYGRCSVVLHDAGKLWQRLPTESVADGEVGEKDISAFLQREIIAKIAPILAKELNKVGDYTKVNAAIANFSTAVKYDLPDLEKMGLHIESTVIENMDFTDESKEIIAKHRDAKVAKIETELVKEQSEQLRSILSAVSENDKEDK